MFDFLKKSLPDDFFRGACDMHCHILPGVDDGFQSEQSSIEALEFLEKKGFEKICLTPHFMGEFPENTRESILPKFEDFKAKAARACKIELFIAAEHMLDRYFLDHHERGFLTLDKDNSLVLCETSYLMCEPNVSTMLYDIMLDGYVPVIAHPERYQYASKHQYERWKEKGYLFQLNLLSLSGAYGGPAFEKAHYMLVHDMYDYVGSDLHKLDRFEMLVPKIKLSAKEIDKLHKLYECNATLF